jgi:hypothetical protein
MGRRHVDRLVEGLTVDERVARLEGVVLGQKNVKGLDERFDHLADTVHELASVERRRAMPWYLRLFFRKGNP